MSPDEPTPTIASKRDAAAAAYTAFEQELHRAFPADSDAHTSLRQPLGAVGKAMAEAAADPAAVAALAAALDVLEDVLEGLLRATGWPLVIGRAGSTP